MQEVTLGYPTLDGNKFTNATFIKSYSDITTFNDFVIAQVIPHELGHYFNLYHTFGNTNAGTQTSELVNGTNCSYTGDEICDTPADPYVDSSWSICYNQSSCAWNCTNTDANGQRYNPSMNNFMSYYNYCRNRFTSGQFYRMSGGLNLRNNVSTDLSQRYYLDGLDRIVLGNPSSTLVCSGSNISVNFGAYGEPSFYKGDYYLQMKAVNGGYFFSNISSPQYTNSGANLITGTIPSNTPTGYYQIRVCKIISESLQRVEERTIYVNGLSGGVTTGSSISSNQYLSASSTLVYNATSTCAGNSIALYGSVSGYDTYWWTKDGLNFTASSTDSYFNASSTGNYTLNMMKCGNVYRSSNSIYLNFYNPTSSLTASSNGASTNFRLATCEGSPVTLSAGCQSGMNSLWNDGTTSSIRYINASSTRDFFVNCNNYFCNTGYAPPVRITALNPNVQSTKTGNWQDVTLWTSNIVPLNCQTVTIQMGHKVNVPINEAKAKNIIIRGNLNFQNVSPTVKGKVGLGI